VTYINTVDAALRAVADPTRRHILVLVRARELAAGEIAAHFPSMSRPAVSQHLKVLAEAGLVEVRREGTHRRYRARPEGLVGIRAFLDEMWRDRLDLLREAAETEARDVAAGRRPVIRPRRRMQ